MRNLLLILLLLVGTISAQAQNIQNNPGSNHGNKFEQLGTIFRALFSQHQMNTALPAVLQDLSIGNNVATMTLSVNWTKKT